MSYNRDELFAQYLISTINPPLPAVQGAIHKSAKDVFARSMYDFIIKSILNKVVILPDEIKELIKNGKL